MTKYLAKKLFNTKQLNKHQKAMKKQRGVFLTSSTYYIYLTRANSTY